jgi:hypothetical protein
MTIKSTIETLSETALDLVAGGIQQNADQDRGNKNRADQNSADGTVGGSIGNAIGGLVVENGGPYSPGHPFDWP